jgi:dihydroorotate dehydrogenase (NAD+) catalytic subunit
MVYKLYDLLPLPIIAYGGVQCWQDAVDYFLAGASIVGLGTCFARKSTAEVVGLTWDIWRGVLEYLDGRSLSEIIGAGHVH